MTENENAMVMPVAPMGNAYAGNGGGFGYGSEWWLILILLFAFGGFGGGFGGFGGYGAGALAADGAMLYPWMNQAQITSNGFQNQALNTAISGLQNSITSGFGDVQLGIAGVNQNICQTGNGIVQAVNGGFANAETAANARQIANMQQAFGAQTAVTQGLNDIGMSLQNCCCENRAGIADLKYTVATENCADRTAAYQNTQAIIEAINTKAQGIQDKLCQLELDNYKGQLAQAQRDNVGLQNQLNMANLAASQVAQTADLRANQATTANQLISELRSCPIPSMPVYGQTPIFTCNQNGTGCGCGCGM